ncbi:hypothetical protein MBLNU459_g0507t1 [Dothideomycetes sp. NU459]
MSPTAATLAVVQLKQLIYYHLDNESLDDANFIAGRLHAIEPRNPDASHLLALTCLRLRRWKAAYDFSQRYGANGRHLGCAFVFALACHELGKHSEGINALEKARNLWAGCNHWGKHGETSRRHTPDEAAVHALLGRLWRGHGEIRRAGDCYIEAHKANPFSWEAFQGLCDIGANVDMANTFKMTQEMTSSFCAVALPTTDDRVREEPLPPSNGPLVGNANHQNVNVLTPSNDPFNPSRVAGDQPSQATDDDVEMGGVQPDYQISFEEPPAAPTRRSKTALQRLGLNSDKDAAKMRPPTLRSQLKFNSESTDNDDAAMTAAQARRAAPTHKRTISGHASQTSAAEEGTSSQPRRSNRLFTQITGSKSSSRAPADAASSLGAKRDESKKAKATGVKGRGPSTVGRVVSGNRKVMPPNPSDLKESRAPNRNSVPPPLPIQKAAVETSNALELAAMEFLLATLRSLGAAYYSLSRYAVSAAVNEFQSLPTAQRETPWVLAQLGKAHYEAADYTAAEACFAKMLKLQPTRIEDTEVYSTVLWQLKKPVQLAFLAHTLRDLDFNAPQTWCAVGNAFSLSREHEQAIACFRRATQVEPNFNYAWTLMGHELLTNEEFDAALAAFRKGVGGERRAYGAWYGLGKCYERMGKWEEAERHYRVAAGINPSNSVLAVCIGVVLEKLHHPKAALVQYSHALGLSPNSALARFKKARVLMTLRLYSDALTELEALKNLAPEEANVFFLLGKCYKGLGQRAAAVRAFTTALNLDPKAAQYIKEAMEALDDSDDEDMDDD